jgi:hypothetical protein
VILVSVLDQIEADDDEDMLIRSTSIIWLVTSVRPQAQKIKRPSTRSFPVCMVGGGGADVGVITLPIDKKKKREKSK